MIINRVLIVLVLTISLFGCTGQLPTTSQTAVQSSTLITPTSTRVVPTPTLERMNLTTSGTISQDEIWREEIHLTGDIFLNSNVTLTIEPGTIVYVASNTDDQHTGGGFDDETTRNHNDPVRLASWTQNAISINGGEGTIIAVGTPDQKIVFRPEGENTSPAQWDGIVIRRGTIQYAILLYGGQVGINAWQPIQPVEIAYDEVRYPHWVGIQGDSQAYLHDNIVEGGGHQGINCTGDCRAENNIVIRANVGIAIEGGKGTIIRNNIVVNSPLGIVLRSGYADILNNSVVQAGQLPDGFYYQNRLIYPAGMAGNGGIWTFTQERVKIVNNIVFGSVDCAYGIHIAPADGSQIDYDLAWGYDVFSCGKAMAMIGSHVIEQDPLFTDVPGMDFHLLPGSPAIDAGAPDQLDEDGSPADLGAFGGPKRGK